VRRREDFLDPYALHSVPKLLAEDLVAVAQGIGERGVVREGIDDLLRGPVLPEKSSVAIVLRFGGLIRY